MRGQLEAVRQRSEILRNGAVRGILLDSPGAFSSVVVAGNPPRLLPSEFRVRVGLVMNRSAWIVAAAVSVVVI